MATKNYDAAPPANKTSVTTGAGSAIGANAVRIIVDDTLVANLAGGGKAEVLRLIDAIKHRIVQDTWPLA